MTIDITPEAVDLARLDENGETTDDQLWRFWANKARALSAALTASQAETAAAYEAAAETYVKGDWDWFSDADDAIRALTFTDSKAALDRMIADARADGMRKAAGIVDNDVHKLQPEMTKRAQRLKAAKSPGFQYAIHRADLDARMSCRDKILAAIPKGSS